MINEHQSIFKLKAAQSRKIWGGSRLSQIKSLVSKDGDLPVGETWEVSVHEEGLSLTNKGPLNNFANSKELTYLVKLLDTADVLSVQVHPDEEYAKAHEDIEEKTECWLILDAKEGDGIYLGFKEGVVKEDFEQALKNGSDIKDFLKFYPVKKGDFYFVPAGAIHAIGANVFLAEIQQSSNITYRVWDWNRVDDQGNSRELHIDKAMDVLNFAPSFNSEENFKITKDVFQKESGYQIVSHDDFKVSLLKNDAKIKVVGKKNSILNFEKEMILKRGEEIIKLEPYESAYLVESEELIEVSGEGNLIHIY
jgi:mannose-6-phosphate isomerase